MVEKGIRGGIGNAIHRYTKADNKYMKDQKKIKNHHVWVQYPENFHNLHNDLLLLPDRMKFEKVEKLVANFNDKTECVRHIANLKQALNYGLVLKKVHRIIKFNQKA